jgi:hypothetical protein
MKALISIFNNLQCVPNNHSGLEATYLSKKYDLYYIGKKGRTNKNEPKYLDIFETDLNKFNKIFLSLSTPNFFGGILSNDTVEKIIKLCDYKGKVGILCNDPRIKPINAAKVVFERFNKLDIYQVDKFQELLDNATYLFPGKDLNKFYNDDKYNDFIYFDYFKEIFKEKIPSPQYVYNSKIYDVVYYGDRRGSYREKQLVKYMPESQENLLVGFKTKKINIPFIKKQKHKELLDVLNRAKVSLILSDEEHNDNVVTFRFYETLASNCLAAIPLEFDPNKELIKDEVLKKILYIESKQDVIDLSGMYTEELIKRQHSEYRRIMHV